MKEKSYSQRQIDWITENNIKIGDRVKVIYLPKTNERGWDNTFTDEMRMAFARTFKVIDFNRNRGIRINDLGDNDGYCWPYFSLQKHEIPKTEDWYKYLECNDIVVSLSDFENIRKKYKTYKVKEYSNGYIWYFNDEGILSCTNKISEFKPV